jgi:hypothetical protein
MNAKDPNRLTDFERRLQAALTASSEGVDARVRSRLNQARQAAIAQAGRSRFTFRPNLWLPALGAATAALLVALVIGLPAQRHAMPQLITPEAARPTAEDLDLLADTEGLDLVQSDFTDGSFYEWAASQGNGSEAPGSGV